MRLGDTAMRQRAQLTHDSARAPLVAPLLFLLVFSGAGNSPVSFVIDACKPGFEGGIIEVAMDASLAGVTQAPSATYTIHLPIVGWPGGPG